MVRLAEPAVKINPESWSYLEILGAASYRAGDFDAAVKRLHEALTKHRKGGTVGMQVFLAMAHHRLAQLHALPAVGFLGSANGLGPYLAYPNLIPAATHASQAQEWLAKAVQQMEKDEKPTDPERKASAKPLSWKEKLRRQLLRKEAQELIDPKPK